MSQPGSANPQPKAPTTKHRFNVYSMMLLLAFIALTAGSFILYYELAKYGSFPYWSTKSISTGS